MLAASVIMSIFVPTRGRRSTEPYAKEERRGLYATKASAFGDRSIADCVVLWKPDRQGVRDGPRRAKAQPQIPARPGLGPGRASIHAVFVFALFWNISITFFASRYPRPTLMTVEYSLVLRKTPASTKC